MKFKLSFAWYDLWMGFYIDVPKRRLYVCPLPTLLFTIELPPRSSSPSTPSQADESDATP